MHSLASLAVARAQGRSIKVERPTPLAVPAGGVVPALAGELAVLAGDAPCRVAVALAPAADGEVRHGVVMGQSSSAQIVSESTGGRRGDRHRGEIHLAVIHGVVRLHLLRRYHLVNGRQGSGQGIQIASEQTLLVLHPLLALPLSLGEFLKT